MKTGRLILEGWVAMGSNKTRTFLMALGTVVGITALTLILGALGLLTDQPWQTMVFLVAMGMLLYTEIISPGYFAQKVQPSQWILHLLADSLGYQLVLK